MTLFVAFCYLQIVVATVASDVAVSTPFVVAAPAAPVSIASVSAVVVVFVLAAAAAATVVVGAAVIAASANNIISLVLPSFQA